MFEEVEALKTTKAVAEETASGKSRMPVLRCRKKQQGNLQYEPSSIWQVPLPEIGTRQYD